MTTGRYPYQVAIVAYGNGGFRFADMSHQGSLLALPSGMMAWPVRSSDALMAHSFDDVLRTLEPPLVFLFGTGAKHVFPAPDVAAAFIAAGIQLETMTTGAASRTYNIMLAEQRPVAAGLIAVP